MEEEEEEEDARGQPLEISVCLNSVNHQTSCGRQAKQPVCGSVLPFPCLDVLLTATSCYIKKPDLVRRGVTALRARGW